MSIYAYRYLIASSLEFPSYYDRKMRTKEEVQPAAEGQGQLVDRLHKLSNVALFVFVGMLCETEEKKIDIPSNSRVSLSVSSFTFDLVDEGSGGHQELRGLEGRVALQDYAEDPQDFAEPFVSRHPEPLAFF